MFRLYESSLYESIVAVSRDVVGSQGGRVESARADLSRVDLGLLSADVGYVLRRAQLAVFADFIRTFADLDIRPAQFAVLLVLHQTPGLRQSQVADALAIKRANFVTLFDGLIARDLVVRMPVPRDRRAVTLHLTPAGEALMPALMDRIADHNRRVTARLGDAGRTEVLALLHRLANLG